MPPTRSHRTRVAASGAAAAVIAALAIPAAAATASTASTSPSVSPGIAENLHPAITQQAKTPDIPITQGMPSSGSIVVQLDLAAQTGAAAMNGKQLDSLSARSEAASTAMQRETEAQNNLVASLTSLHTGASVLYRTTALTDAVAVRVDASKLGQLAKLPGVTGIHEVAAKFRSNTRAVPLTGSPQVWGVAGGAGKGVNIGIVDTGIDYTHADFGGAGTVAAYDNARKYGTVLKDGNGNTLFPTAKVTGGTDLVGDAYDGGYNEDGTVDTDPSHITPAPDPNPLDCSTTEDSAVGHGTHVAGIAAGYGVNTDGSTYTGAYNADTDFTKFHVGPGTAPEATLSAWRVFGCQGATFVVSEALDDIAKTRMDSDPSNDVDIVNLSLGADLTRADDPDAANINRLAQLGVLPVVAAGNSGDLYEIGGSPGDAVRALTAAATDDGGATTDALKVDTPAADAGLYPGGFGAAYGIATKPGVTNAGVFRPTDAGDQASCAAWTSATDKAGVLGKVALIDADGYAAGGSCGSVTKGNNAVAAGAIGVVIIEEDENLNSINGAANAPTIEVQASTGAKLIADEATATVDISYANHNAGNLSQPENVDKIADFTSRGGVQNDSMKPDVGAPGVSIFSAASGTGSDGISYDGTSMATPHTAGIAAEVLGVHPNYTAEQLKAAVMDTADSDLYVDGAAAAADDPADAQAYAPDRVGTGRVRADLAVPNDVLAYVGDGSGSVSANFGLINMAVPTFTVTKQITIQNTGPTSETYTPSLLDSTPQTGVVFSVPTDPITVAANSSTSLPLTVTVTRDQLSKSDDPTRDDDVAGFTQQFVAEATGRLSLTPDDDSLPTLRVDYGTAARPASIMGTTQSSLTYAPTDSVQDVTLAGTGVANGTAGLTSSYSSPVSAFTLQGTSPQLPSCLDNSPTQDQGPAGCIFFPSERAGDLKYVGTNSTVPQDGIDGGMVDFAISTYAPWVTPSWNYSRGTVGDVRYRIYVDTNGDGKPERLVDVERAVDDTDLLAADTYDLSKVGYTNDDGSFTVVPPTDPTFDDVLKASPDAITDVEFLNGVDGSTDTDLLNSDVLFAPVSATGLGLTASNTKFAYDVVTQSLDNLPVTLDNVGPISTDAAHPALSVAQPANTKLTGGTPATTLFRDQPGLTLPIALDRASTGPDLGLLLLHFYNVNGARAQMLPVTLQTPPPPVVCTPSKASFLAVAGKTSGAKHYGKKYSYKYVLSLKPVGGTCTPPSVAGRGIGLYDNGKKIGQFTTGKDGTVTASIHLAKGKNNLTAVFYGAPDLSKSVTGKALAQPANLKS